MDEERTGLSESEFTEVFPQTGIAALHALRMCVRSLVQFTVAVEQVVVCSLFHNARNFQLILSS